MPGTDGWGVLDRLKHHPDTRHIPVHIITGIRERQQGLKAGAIAYLEKPVSTEALEESFNKIGQFIDQQVKRLLVVEDDDAQRSSMVELIAHEDVEITAVATADEALEQLAATHFDCMVLDLGLEGDLDGFQLLETIKSDPAMKELPIIIYTGKELTPQEETRLRQFAETIIVKDVKSPERLLDETALFLHRVEARLPEQKRRMLERLHSTDAVFAGKNVLVVDDDVRNIFSLTSMLEEHGMNVSFAENGRGRDREIGLDAGHRFGADGRDDAGNGRLRDDARDPRAAAIPRAAHHRAHGEGDEGRPGEVHRGGRIGLHHQARGHGPAAQSDAGMAVPLTPTAADVETPSPLEASRPLDGPPVSYDPELERVEIELLLEGVFRHYGFDFRCVRVCVDPAAALEAHHRRGPRLDLGAADEGVARPGWRWSVCCSICRSA